MKMKLWIGYIALLLIHNTIPAQTPDTVEVNLASSSKAILILQDRQDLSQLRQYDYAALFDDILTRLEKKDTTAHTVPTPSSPSTSDTPEQAKAGYTPPSPTEHPHHSTYHPYPQSRHFFNVDFGLNNYLENGEFPSENSAQYSVRPWGSWYIGFNAVHHEQLFRFFSLEGSLGLSWYNFKFDDDDTRVSRGVDEVIFDQDPRNLHFTKSKLTVCYINASFIPMFNTGESSRNHRWHRPSRSEFRIGAGPYVGYRVASYAKQQFNEDGDKQIERERDPFYLENIRYGVRLQIGIHDADFFVNYDLNSLFRSGKGPELNAYSFGVIF